jgi:hypothetical protein
MNHKSILSIIVLDVIVMALAVGLIIFRYSSLSEMSPAAPHAAVPSDASPAAVPAPHTPATVNPQATAAPSPSERAKEDMEQPANAMPRNIGFVFRHSKARKVEIIGDFNGWAPKPMIKGKDFRWTISLPIPPGEYAYNFVVDGKPIRDPNNQKVCDVGRGFPNSMLKVKSLADENKLRE